MLLKDTVTAVARLVGIKTKPRVATYEDVEREFLLHHPSADTSFLKRAYEFAEKAHTGQIRRSGEPYFNHPTAVAFILAQAKLDMETVAGGLLHDVIEDCNISLLDIEREFSPGLARIVDGVTKIGKVKFRDKAEAQVENYRKMLVAMAEDVRVLLVKLADRCHNMQTLSYLDEEKQRRISQETLDIYIPLAHRLGMNSLKLEMERLAFFYLEPEAYARLDQQLNERNQKNRVFLERITEQIQKQCEDHGVKATVTSRIKSHYSIFRKMEKKQAPLEALYDYYAFRILTDTVESCYKVFGLLHGKWQHIPGRIKDFIATPKPNLYQSIHTTLLAEQGQPFEVQVRTQMMHRIAEEGVAAHWTYKNGRLLSVGKNEFIAWLKQVAEDQEEVRDHQEFLDTMKGQLQTEEILVFTPAGEIKSLVKGATPLDFAYTIHTEVGHHAVGAKVDGKMVPLRSELQSGSIVEILTKDTQRPSEMWLQIVKSPSARAKIRSWLRAEEKKSAIDLGKSLFEKELRRFKVPLKQANQAALLKVLPDLNIKKIEDFYSSIGFGHLTPRRAVKPFLPEGSIEEQPSADEIRQNRFRRAFQGISRKSQHMVLVKGINDILVTLAKCCNPIIGDEIVGYITQGRGVTIHNRACRAFLKQNIDPERKVSVAWDPASKPQLFTVQLRVYTEDRTRMIADISLAIAASGTNVLSLEAKVNEEKSMGIFDIGIQVQTLDHFQKVINLLKQVKGFLSYERLN